jgi:hypothetical protein
MSEHPAPASPQPGVSKPVYSSGWSAFFILMSVLLVVGYMAYIESPGTLWSSNVERFDAMARDPSLPQETRDWARGARLQAEARLEEWQEGSAARTRSVVFGVGPLALMLFMLGRRLRARGALRLLTRDRRAPILYLRSFQADGTNSPDDEAKLAHVLSRHGPVIAIGRPGEGLAHVGAARLYVSEARWREVSERMMEDAQLVVLRAGHTPGLLWELRRLRDRAAPEKVLILVPDTVPYEQFREEASQAMGVRFPRAMNGRRFITFGLAWTPVSVGGGFDTRLPGAFSWQPGASPKSELRTLLSRRRGVSAPQRGRVLALLEELDRAAEGPPPFRLAWFALPPALALGAALLLFPSAGTAEEIASTRLWRGAEFAASVVLALAASFIPWFHAPARRRLPTTVFSVALLLHLGIVGYRSLAAKAAREDQEDSPAAAGPSRSATTLRASAFTPAPRDSAYLHAVDEVETRMRELVAAGGADLRTLTSPEGIDRVVPLAESLLASLRAAREARAGLVATSLPGLLPVAADAVVRADPHIVLLDLRIQQLETHLELAKHLRRHAQVDESGELVYESGEAGERAATLAERIGALQTRVNEAAARLRAVPGSVP